MNRDLIKHILAKIDSMNEGEFLQALEGAGVSIATAASPAAPASIDSLQTRVLELPQLPEPPPLWRIVYERPFGLAELQYHTPEDTIAHGKACAQAVFAAFSAPSLRPAHETIVPDGDRLVCTACGTSTGRFDETQSIDQPEFRERLRGLGAVVDRNSDAYKLLVGFVNRQIHQSNAAPTSTLPGEADCHPSCGYLGAECDYPACKTSTLACSNPAAEPVEGQG